MSGNRPPQWRLTDLIERSEGSPLEEALVEVRQAAVRFAACREELAEGPSVERFREIIALREALQRAQRRVEGYATLWFSEDTQNPDAQALRATVERLRAESTNQALFFDLWWKRLDERDASYYRRAAEPFAYYLETLRRERPYTLSEAEEVLINTKNVTGVETLRQLYEMRTGAFLYPVDVDGETQRLTRAELMARAHQRSPEVREAAYRALLQRFEEERGLLGTIYHAVASDWDAEHVALRGYPRPISRRNKSNDLEDGVVDLVLDLCRENAGIFHRYFEAKAKHLQLPALRRFDLYAPWAEEERTFAFGEAMDLIRDALGSFSTPMAEMAQRVLEDEHLDAQPRPAKADGAFCYGVLPELTPWVMVNFVGQLEDVSTLAHELGHAIHAQMGREHPALTVDPSLPLAETASVFSEILLLETLLERERSAEVQRGLLGRFIDGVYATLLRQAYFVLFECAAHDQLGRGSITADALASRYLEGLREQFGASVVVDDLFRWEWLSIPHIYAVPFYCYAYSFGQLLVLALYRQYQHDPDAFLPRYERILAYGGAAGPAPVLAEAGIDIADRTFWQGGFDALAGFIDRLTQL
jgi:oligoendopeptidase F